MILDNEVVKIRFDLTDSRGESKRVECALAQPRIDGLLRSMSHEDRRKPVVELEI